MQLPKDTEMTITSVTDNQSAPRQVAPALVLVPPTSTDACTFLQESVVRVLPQRLRETYVPFCHVAKGLIRRQRDATVFSFQSFEEAERLQQESKLVKQFRIECDGNVSVLEAAVRAVRALSAQWLVVPWTLSSTSWLGSAVKCTPPELILARLVDLEAKDCAVVFPKPLDSTKSGDKDTKQLRRIIVLLDMNHIVFHDPPAIVRSAVEVASLQANGEDNKVRLILIGCFTPNVAADPSGASFAGAPSNAGDSNAPSWSEEYRTREKLAREALDGINDRVGRVFEHVEVTPTNGHERLRELMHDDGSSAMIAVHRHKSVLLTNQLARWRSYVWRDATEVLLREFAASADILISL